MRPAELLNEYESLYAKLRLTMPDNPACRGWKTFSQNDEDGIIHECLRRIATETPLSRTFIELACGDGLENCTHQLLLEGFSGIWIDGNDNHIAMIKRCLGGLSFPRLAVALQFVTLENLSALLAQCKEALNGVDIDFFSLDVDGNDLYFADVIAHEVRPKLFLVEYTAKFPPPIELSIRYNPEFISEPDDFQGASLQAFVSCLKDYTLVSCSVAGVNAFFVRNDFAHLFSRYSVEEIYQPPRYWLTSFQLGHQPTFKWLYESLMFRN